MAVRVTVRLPSGETVRFRASCVKPFRSGARFDDPAGATRVDRALSAAAG